MKTFKLKGLHVMENVNEEIIKHKIQLLDGLIINREDENGRWTIEAFVEKDYYDFFNQLRCRRDEIMVEVRITKENNEPATFITSIHGINEIEDKMNVILIGKIVDQRKSKIEEMLRQLIEEGYQGEELLDRFKTMID